MKRLLAALGVLALAAAACGDDAVEFTTTTQTTSTTASTSTTAATTTTTSVPEASSTTVGDPGDVADEAEALIAVTEELRGRRFLEPVQVTVLSPEELAERVRADIAEELDPADLAVEEAFAQLLGILPADVDFAAAITDLYAEQVGGFYDPDTGELVVAGGEDLSALSRIIVVHELIHALMDQHFGFGAELDALIEAERYHEAAALQALVEGDATYFQLVYLQEYLSPEEQVEAVTESLEADMTVLESLPDWVGEDLAFPYEWGFGFVERLVEEGGAAAVDQAYELLPATVEQVMHPTAYFALEPARAVELPATALEGYEVFEEGAFGEWNLLLYLLEGVGDGDATVASSGWGGDAYRVHWNGSQVAFAYLFEGDTPRDAEELQAALVESLGANMAVGSPAVDEAAGTALLQGADYAFVQRSGNRILVVIADDPAAGQTLVAALRLPPPG